MVTRLWRWCLQRLAPLAIVTIVMFVGLAIYSNVPTNLTGDDRRVFASMGLKAQERGRTFDDEIALIRQVQADVFLRAPVGLGIAANESREPADLMERVRHGLCYDRSRTLDKAYTYLGFEARHVYLLFREGKPFVSALFTRRHPSHAVTEVRTSRGWMFVDSNTPWIALTPSGDPINADDVYKRYAEFSQPPAYLDSPWWAIRGMYSRKGNLYSRYTMFPEFNWRDFLSWATD